MPFCLVLHKPFLTIRFESHALKQTTAYVHNDLSLKANLICDQFMILHSSVEECQFAEYSKYAVTMIQDH